MVRKFSTSAVREKAVSVPLKLYNIEGRYATALYTAATKQNKLDQVEKEIKTFQNLIRTEKKVNEFLFNPSYQRQAKKVAMSKLAQSQKFSDLTGNFLGLLAENGRLPKINGVLGAFSNLMSAHRGEVICTVTSAKPLAANEEKDLKAALQGFAKKGQNLQLTMKVDPAIMGGIVVNIGDKFVDMSTATKVKKYASLLKEAV